MIHATDLDLAARQVSELASPDALAAFFANLGYETAVRTVLTPESVGLEGESANAIKRIELLSEDTEQFLRVVFAQSKSLTAKVRNDLVRVLGRSNVDHLLVLVSDFETLEFVFLDKLKRESRGPIALERIQVVPKTISVNRRNPSRLDLRTLRRFTWTFRDGLEQFDKLRSVFDAAAYTGEYFQNRGLFADYFLRDRLRDDSAWRDNPSEMFAFVRDTLRDASHRWSGKEKGVLRKELLEPLFQRLGFKAVKNRPSKSDQTEPDYLLKDASGDVISAAFVYPWDRWLDGPDLHDPDTPEENPGACVVTALDQEHANWIIVTNGKLWRIYSREAHARATNFYEVDLVEALTATGDTDPNEAFRYWWLFFRREAFQSSAGTTGCWLDVILRGSRDFAKRLGDRLKDRVFLTIFPHLAQGFLEDRKQRLGVKTEPTEAELSEVFEATLTLLYRLLFLLYAESRDLLPIREAPYFAASLKRIKEEVELKAGVAESEVPERIQKAYSAKETSLYDRLTRLFQAMDKGDPVLNVPTYNGGLFNTVGWTPSSDRSDEGVQSTNRSVQPTNRNQQIARFLLDHKIPDRHLALAIDRLSRDQDERTLALVFIDYKSLEVRHLGSIYEGLLEFKLKVAEEDLTTLKDAKNPKVEKYIALTAAKPKRGQAANVVVRKKEVYLSNDKSERKATGSYYTPDNIVEYIVANTVGPVLEEKLEALRPEFRKVRKTFDNELQKSKVYPPADVRGGKLDHRQWAGMQTYNAHKDLVESLFDLKVLDPAMGSGHFLVEVVDFVTDRLLNFLNQFPINPVTFALERTRASILGSLGEQGVTVDPSKLTDINLLKRHVLKRSVYGVDINPMAVELGKVSLWLDAFTLGAPLNFLDHHLRCGNSLIGATFSDLRQAVKGRLFGVDYAPLLDAIHKVLIVSKLSDATAAEVRQSADLYGSARENLSAYQVMLDLLVAKHFGFEDAPDVLTHAGNELDLTSRKKFLECIEDVTDRMLVERVAEMARQPDRRFLHWEIEFPEVFFGFADANERRIQHKDELANGSAGFDCVVGNPPYVRMELIKPIKPFLRTHYRCHAERADLFIYFYERAVNLLRQEGRTAFIASSNWTKTVAGESLRGFLATNFTLISYVDLTEANVFEDASTYPCVLVIHKQKPTPTQVTTSRYVSQPVRSASDLLANAIAIKQSEITSQPWRFGEAEIVSLHEKLTAQRPTLAQVYGAPLYGIKTGLNEAFVISRELRDQLIAQDAKSADILRPFLEGKDVHPWHAEPRDLWLIYTPRGTNICRYPAIENYLSQFRGPLEQRATSQDWFELQQAQARYAPSYSAAKIIYPRFVNQPCFAFDDRGFFINNAISAIPAADPVLLFYLMSPVSWFFLHTSGAPMANGYRQIHGHVLEQVPIPTFGQAAILEITDWVHQQNAANLDRSPPWHLVFEAFGLSDQETSTLLGAVT